MISVQEALFLITQQVSRFTVEEVPLLNATGRVLAQEVSADRDFPPFNRATMDGIAINSVAFNQGIRNFQIEAIQPAGHPQLILQESNQCIEIMTGAMLPLGCDAVIRYEDLEMANQSAKVNLEAVTPFQNVHLQGTDEKEGEILIKQGVKVTPAIIAIMASVGISQVKVYRRTAATPDTAV
jgi:molybdopterin molybdotransferase